MAWSLSMPLLRHFRSMCVMLEMRIVAAVEGLTHLVESRRLARADRHWPVCPNPF